MFRFRHFSKLYYSLGLIVLIIFIGTIGYMLIEKYNLLDAFYMTIITVSTVGFREIAPLSDSGKVFTVFLIITSFGTFAYAVTSVSRYVLEGEFNAYFKKYKLNTAIEKLQNHVVICGFGRNGRQAAIQLKNHGHPFIIVEKDEAALKVIHENKFLCVEGDGTRDEILLKTNLEKASALITTLPIDADNLFIVLTARNVNPKLTIISRASDDNSDKKLKTAGANNVIMPDKIGGAHMASLVMKPDVIEFIDYITGQGGVAINLEEITFDHLTESAKNLSIRDLEVRNRSGANIVGFKTAEGEYIVNPSPDTKIIPNAKIFVLGTHEQISKMKEIFS